MVRQKGIYSPFLHQTHPGSPPAMPLFKTSERRSVTPPGEDEQQPHKGSIFSRRSDSVLDGDTNNKRTGSMRSANGRWTKDPSIAAAREKVRIAEEGEKAADKALDHARQAVADAREHARKLELEAEEG
jgi:hypothetical protein